MPAWREDSLGCPSQLRFSSGAEEPHTIVQVLDGEAGAAVEAM